MRHHCPQAPRVGVAALANFPCADVVEHKKKTATILAGAVAIFLATESVSARRAGLELRLNHG
jgi:hypothetical protein